MTTTVEVVRGWFGDDDSLFEALLKELENYRRSTETVATLDFA
jgi:hypothetical protein